jgi:hypothetical protein
VESLFYNINRGEKINSEGIMGLEHEFYLVSETMNLEELFDLRKSSKVIDRVIIHDDLIQYINDSLVWIPSKNPAKQANSHSRGINYHGITLLDQQSANALKGIFTSWRDLFKNAPDTFKLTGNFVEGENEQEGTYEKISINRDEVVNQLEKIISMSEYLATGNGFLYHYGI